MLVSTLYCMFITNANVQLQQQVASVDEDKKSRLVMEVQRRNWQLLRVQPLEQANCRKVNNIQYIMMSVMLTFTVRIRTSKTLLFVS